MNSSFRPRLTVRVSVPRVQPPADGIELPPDDDSMPACGWYESSLALREGLAVRELPDGDGSVAALWFAALRAAEAAGAAEAAKEADAWPAAALQ